MSKTMVIELPEDRQAELSEALRVEGMTEAELVSKALDDYLTIRKLRLLRERFAQAGRSFLDEDIFEQVS